METLAYSVIFLLTFLAVGIAAGVAWVYIESPEKRKPESDLLRGESLSTLRLLSLFLSRLQVSENLKRLLSEANLEWSVGRLTLLILVAGSVAAALLLRLSFVPKWAAILIAAGIASAPFFYVQGVRAKRLRKVEEQLPEALEFISRALVAGHSLPMAMELLADEIGGPLSTELRKTVDEYNLGLSMTRALENLTERLPSVDIQFFASAIMTQSRTGGNLHELLDGLADTIRERETLKGQVRALTANGRATAFILASLPFFIAGIMMTVNSDYLMILVHNPIGKTLLFAGFCGQVLAFFAIRKIVDIKI